MDSYLHSGNQRRKPGYGGRQNSNPRPLFGRFSVLDDHSGGIAEQSRKPDDSPELGFYHHFINTLVLNDPETVLKTGVRELSRLRPEAFLLLCREAEDQDTPLLLATGPEACHTSRTPAADSDLPGKDPEHIQVIELRPSAPAVPTGPNPRRLYQAATSQNSQGEQLTLYTDFQPTKWEQCLLECCLQYLHKRYDEAQKWQTLNEICRHDSLTGLFNRRHFDQILPQECERSSRYQRPLALIMLDLDHFKRINDRFGHPAGDRVLQECGRLLKETLRRNDIPCRYGGEEIAIILPETSLDEASRIAHRLRRQLAKLDIGFSTNSSDILKITASFGVSASEQAEPDLLVATADQALYRAKSGGRNQVALHSDESLKSVI